MTKTIFPTNVIALKYKNINLKQPGSLWLSFDTESNEKLRKKAYINGKLVDKSNLHKKIMP